MKLTYQQIDELNSVYLLVPFKGKAITAAGKNLAKLKPHLDTALTVKGKLVRQYTEGKESISQDDQNWDKFVNDYSAFLQETAEVNLEDFKKLKEDDIDTDNIPKTDGKPINVQPHIGVLFGYGLLLE